MHLQFRQEKATQAAPRLLKLRGGRMSYMKLLKLLYLADRKALVEHSRPITSVRYVSMNHGPVLSQTYNLMVSVDAPDAPPYWRRYISGPTNYEVTLLQDVASSDLSPAQEKVLDAIFDEFGQFGRRDWVRVAHELPEWHDQFLSAFMRCCAPPVLMKMTSRAWMKRWSPMMCWRS